MTENLTMTADLGPNQLVNNCRLARIWCAQNADLKEALHCIGTILCTHVAWFVMAVSLSCAVFPPQAFAITIASTIANSRRVLTYQMCRFQALTWKKFSEDILSCSLRYFDTGCLCQRILLYWRKTGIGCEQPYPLQKELRKHEVLDKFLTAHPYS